MQAPAGDDGATTPPRVPTASELTPPLDTLKWLPLGPRTLFGEAQSGVATAASRTRPSTSPIRRSGLLDDDVRIALQQEHPTLFVPPGQNLPLGSRQQELDKAATVEYHDWYFAQQPRDPRLDPPLIYPHYQATDRKKKTHPSHQEQLAIPSMRWDTESPPLTPPLIEPIHKPLTPLDNKDVSPSSGQNIGGVLFSASSSPSMDPGGVALVSPPDELQLSVPPPPVNCSTTGSSLRMSTEGFSLHSPPKPTETEAASPAHGTAAYRATTQRQTYAGVSASEISPSLLSRLRGGASTTELLVWADLRGSAVACAHDHTGRAVLQRFLSQSDDHTYSEIFRECLPELGQLVYHAYGNYVVQNLLEYGTLEHRRTIVETFSGEMPDMARNVYACRVIQKAMEKACSKVAALHQTVLQLVEELYPIAAELSMHKNGNHVLQKIIECFTESACITPLIVSLTAEAETVASHAYGCRVLQRLLDKCGPWTEDHETTTGGSEASRAAMNTLATRLTDQEVSVKLSEGQYGNYIMQAVLDRCGSKFHQRLFDALLTRIPVLSQQKYASNVIEKLVTITPESSFDRLVNSLVQSQCPDPEDQGRSVPSFVAMMQDRYANYVVKHVIDNATVKHRVSIVNVVVEVLDTVPWSTYGLHMLTRMIHKGWIEEKKVLVALRRESEGLATGGTKRYAHGATSQTAGSRTASTQDMGNERSSAVSSQSTRRGSPRRLGGVQPAAASRPPAGTSGGKGYPSEKFPKKRAEPSMAAGRGGRGRRGGYNQADNGPMEERIPEMSTSSQRLHSSGNQDLLHRRGNVLHPHHADPMASVLAPSDLHARAQPHTTPAPDELIEEPPLFRGHGIPFGIVPHSVSSPPSVLCPPGVSPSMLQATDRDIATSAQPMPHHHDLQSSQPQSYRPISLIVPSSMHAPHHVAPQVEQPFMLFSPHQLTPEVLAAMQQTAPSAIPMAMTHPTVTFASPMAAAAQQQSPGIAQVAQSRSSPSTSPPVISPRSQFFQNQPYGVAFSSAEAAVQARGANQPQRPMVLPSGMAVFQPQGMTHQGLPIMQQSASPQYPAVAPEGTFLSCNFPPQLP